MRIDRFAPPLTPTLSPRCGEREPPIFTMRLLPTPRASGGTLCLLPTPRASGGTLCLLPSPRASGERGGGEGWR